MTKAVIVARVYGTAAAPRAAASVTIFEGTDVVAGASFLDEHLVIFNCVGAMRIESMIDVLRAAHPGIEVAVYLEENEEVGHVDSSVTMDVNRKLAEAA